MFTITLLVASLLLLCATAKPAEPKCSAEGSTCRIDSEKCCDGLTCLTSGEDRVKRCFLLSPSVEYEEVSCQDKKLPYYGEKQIARRHVLKGCCLSEAEWISESKNGCCLLAGSIYREKQPIPCCRKQTASDRNGTLVCPDKSGNPLDDDVVDIA